MGAITDVAVLRGAACRGRQELEKAFRPRKLAIMTYGHGERKTKGPAEGATFQGILVAL